MLPRSEPLARTRFLTSEENRWTRQFGHALVTEAKHVCFLRRESTRVPARFQFQLADNCFDNREEEQAATT